MTSPSSLFRRKGERGGPCRGRSTGGVNTSLWFGEALLPGGWARDVRITVADGLITAVEPSVLPAPGDERHGAVVPGMNNLHSHAFQRAMAGLTERGSGDDSFWTWRDLMYRYLAQLTPDDVEAITALAYMEMLEGGFTRVGEFHYLHHDIDGRPYADPAEMAGRICAAAASSGIGLTLLPVFYAHAGFGGLPPTDGQKRFIHNVDGFNRLLDDCRRPATGDTVIGRALHSLRAITPQELAALATNEGPVHIHIAEQEKEVSDCLAWSGRRPVEWLFEHTDVRPNWCLVHATHMTPSERTMVARSNAVAGLCPVTEANLGDGVFPAEAFLAEGGRFGIGSDSNLRIDATEELRLLEYSQRLFLKKRNIVDGLYNKALQGGAQALGVGSGIAIGNAADLVSLDLDHAGLIEKTGDDLLDAWIFSVGKSAIDCVWRRGRKVVAGGRHLRRDSILAAVRPVLARLKA